MIGELPPQQQALVAGPALSRANLLDLIKSAREVIMLEKFNYMEGKLAQGLVTPVTKQPGDAEWTQLYNRIELASCLGANMQGQT